MLFILSIGLYTSRVILHIIGVEDYGIYNVVCGFVAMFAFLNSSMATGIQRYVNYELGKSGKSGANNVFNMALVIQSILGLVILLFTETIGLWYLHCKMNIPADRMFAASWIYQLSILNFLFIIFEIPFRSVILAHEKINFLATINIIEVILKLLVLYLIPVIPSDHLIVYGVFYTSIGLFNLFAFIFYAKTRIEEVYLNSLFNKALFKSMIGFSGWNIMGTFSIMMREQGVNLVLNAFYGPVVNAARGIAVQINSGLLHVVRNITIPARPQVVQSYAANDIQRALKLTYSISKLSFLFLYVVAMPILVEINFILRVWLGDTFPAHTQGFVIAIVASSFFHNFYIIISDLAQATGIIKKYQIMTSAMIVLSVPLAYITLKIGASPEWAMWMTVFSMLAAFILAIRELRRIMPFPITEYIEKVLRPITLVVITSCLFPFLPHAFLSEGWTRFIATSAISFFSIGTSIFYLGLNDAERGLITGVIQKRLHK